MAATVMDPPQGQTPVDVVKLRMDYALIEHFSNHLYSSPYKALEELVSNGFDAWATSVRIYLDGRYGNGRILVWDDGDSMDIEGLKTLWVIAKSPKQNARSANKGGKFRAVIGKFGIGKLASYSLGKSIAHLCKKGERYLLVEVNYERVKDALDVDDETKLFSTPIIELDAESAKEYIEASFNEQTGKLAELYAKQSWTLAIVSDLHEDKHITAKRLLWTLGLSMPLRPDFKVYVDDNKVNSLRFKKEGAKEWDFGSEEVQSHLKQLWAADERPEDDLVFGTQRGLDPEDEAREVPFVEAPSIGKVWGSARFYQDSLLRSQDKDLGRSYGVFLMVNDRLVNSEDDRLFLKDPSFGVFYRSQYLLYADAVDTDLLADREGVKRDTPRTSALKLIEQALYKVTVDEYNKLEQEGTAPSAALLPTYSRHFFIQPVFALLAQDRHAKQTFPIASPQIDLKPFGKDSKLARLNSSTGFEVNSNHPYTEAIEAVAGAGKKGKQFLREFQKFAVGEELFHGYLLEIGLDDAQVVEIMHWRDLMLRHLARVTRDDVEQLIRELHDASFVGGTQFEQAIREVLTAMGFFAETDGASGRKDVYMLAPCGESDSYTMIFEAKGKNRGSLPNDDAEISGANAHRVACEADHAVVVAREFAGFAGNRTVDPQIIEECRSQIDENTNQPAVSIMTVDALSALLRVMDKHKFSLELVKDVFTIIESPAEKMERISKLDEPLTDFDYPQLLERLYQYQKKYEGKEIPIRQIWLEYYRKTLPETDFLRIFQALYLLAQPLMSIDAADNVSLRQSPENVLETIRGRLDPSYASSDRAVASAQ